MKTLIKNEIEELLAAEIMARLWPCMMISLVKHVVQLRNKEIIT